MNLRSYSVKEPVVSIVPSKQTNKQRIVISGTEEYKPYEAWKKEDVIIESS